MIGHTLGLRHNFAGSLSPPSSSQIATQRASMTGTAAELTDDLLARIDAATHPYFK